MRSSHFEASNSKASAMNDSSTVSAPVKEHVLGCWKEGAYYWRRGEPRPALRTIVSVDMRRDPLTGREVRGGHSEVADVGALLICLHTHVCMHACMYVCMYVCM